MNQAFIKEKAGTALGIVPTAMPQLKYEDNIVARRLEYHVLVHL